jgi:hypothetical protein
LLREVKAEGTHTDLELRDGDRTPDTARNLGGGFVNFLFSDGVSAGESSFFLPGYPSNRLFQHRVLRSALCAKGEVDPGREVGQRPGAARCERELAAPDAAKVARDVLHPRTMKHSYRRG